MKKLFITAATAILFSVTAFASNSVYTVTPPTGEENISYAALNKFNSEFRNAKNPAWSVTPNCQKVTFTLDDTQMTAFYDLNSEYLGVTQDVAFKTVPVEAREVIAKKYSGYTTGEVIKFQYDGDNTELEPLVYFVDLKKADSEIVVKVTTDASVTFFKKVK